MSVPLGLTGTPQPIGTEPTTDFLPAGETDRVWLLHGTSAAGGRAELAGLAGPAEDPLPGARLSVAWSPGTAVPAASADGLLALTPGSDPSLGWLRRDAATPTPIAAADACVRRWRRSAAPSWWPCTPVRRGATACSAWAPPGWCRRRGIPAVAQVRPIAVAPDGGGVLLDGLDAQGQELGSWIVDFGTGAVRREDQLPLASSSRATWSPDGQRLVMVSTHEGVTSLGLYDWRTDRYEAHPVPLDPVGGDAALGQVATDALALRARRRRPDARGDVPAVRGAVVGELGTRSASNVGLEACRLPGLGDPAPAAAGPASS